MRYLIRVGKWDEATTLFVYGSLLDAAHREEVLKRRVETASAVIRDYERGRIRHFYLRKRPGIDTPGLLLLNLTRSDFATLDRYEEVPLLYTREKVEVLATAGGIIGCWVYMPTARVTANLNDVE
jgi:gamma-glutamylcyclotransferase (GGCT)/AIG2-like uncharacterized protein YtfP